MQWQRSISFTFQVAAMEISAEPGTLTTPRILYTLHVTLLPTPPAFLKSPHPCIYKVINETFRAFSVGQLHCVFKGEEDRAGEREKEKERMEDKCRKREREQIEEWARNAPPSESS